jgi:hypothetical protein
MRVDSFRAHSNIEAPPSKLAQSSAYASEIAMAIASLTTTAEIGFTSLHSAEIGCTPLLPGRPD